ncbi:ATP-binding protein [Geoalkalibacter halelectricus]|uniref:ATP-binding protein n=1 Tax=Geoalkalibacter halelectricus TaxID=2847045 RepID=UPI003D1CFB66
MPLMNFAFIGLRARFMALAVVLTLASSAAWGTWTWQRERNLLEESVLREGRMLVSAMAIPVINALLYQDLGVIEEGGLLDTFIADIMANRQLNPRYALVVDPQGWVLAHNHISEYGTFYSDPLTRQVLTASSIVESEHLYNGERVLDFAIPLAIAGKRWGGLRVGVSLEPLHRQYQALARRILSFAVFFSLVSMVVYYIVGTRLSRPLISLAEHMEEIRHCPLPASADHLRRDEIGRLQNSFYRMLDRLHQHEKERQSALERILGAERRTRTIVLGVAHEVNNPLAGVEGALYQIDAATDAQQVRRYTALIRKSIDRIGKIVHQLLDLGRAGAMEIKPVESGELFSDLALFAKMALSERDCRLETVDDCPVMTLYLDRDKIHQVILNLILNSADALDGNGTIRFRAYAGQQYYCLQVQDNGPGISTELRDKIFEPFFTTKEAGKGSGMGLAISRSIVESHGGVLELFSEEGQGALFVVKIPLTPWGEGRNHG